MNGGCSSDTEGKGQTPVCRPLLGPVDGPHTVVVALASQDDYLCLGGIANALAGEAQVLRVPRGLPSATTGVPVAARRLSQRSQCRKQQQADAGQHADDEQAQQTDLLWRTCSL